jgi:trehalose 6-phosphate phosphatase
MSAVVERFLREVGNSQRAVLGLDYDGTLAPFRRRPQDAFPYARMRTQLQQIMAGGRTRVVLVSGRPAADVRDMMALWPSPEIWGAHGWERLRSGVKLKRMPVDGSVAEMLARVRTALEACELLAHAEWKPASVAVHWRDASNAVDIEARARAALSPLVADPEFELMPIVEGLEWRCRRWHKGTALSAVISEEMQGTPVAYVGDDQTDEDAFHVLAGRPCALGLRVASGPVATAAAAIVAPASGVIRFLEQWRGAWPGAIASGAVGGRKS